MCATQKGSFLAGGILFSNGTTFAVLLALTQALLFLTTKSFWPVAVFVVARITSLTETSSQFLQDYGDGIVPIGFVLIALSVIFVAFMLHPYIDKRHQARSSSEFLEKPWCASKIWRWVNYFLLFAASATSFISLSYVAEGSSTLSALWSAYSSFNISHDGFPLSFSHTKSRRKSVSKNTTLCHANYLRSLATRLSPILCWLSFRAAPTAPYRNHFFNYAFLCDMLVFRHRLFFSPNHTSNLQE